MKIEFMCLFVAFKEPLNRGILLPVFHLFLSQRIFILLKATITNAF